MDAEGGWRCPPGEDHAGPFGFFYRVRSSAEINWVFQRNLLFLEDYLRSDCPAVDPSLVQALVARVTAQPGLSLQSLLQEATRVVEGATPDDIYTLIATERLYVDLSVFHWPTRNECRFFVTKWRRAGLASACRRYPLLH